ncbi:hypothetical protein, partial [Escherichia coli]|uniref:hypothetical protein n=1 Tax=Escherichia coli TaxID=562 RepID=UPI0019650F5E
TLDTTTMMPATLEDVLSVAFKKPKDLRSQRSKEAAKDSCKHLVDDKDVARKAIENSADCKRY